jgi:hypothetical protein
MDAVDVERVRVMFEVLSPTGALDRARGFARSMRRSLKDPGGLLVVGTPGYEPWHFTAHLADEARYAGLSELEPTLVRWHVPPDAPTHLAVPLDRLVAARRGETLLVVTEERAPEQLLERVLDAKKVGATIFTMDVGDPELGGLAHESLVAPADGAAVQAGAPPTPAEPVGFDLTQHVVSVAASERERSAAKRARDRLARFLDLVSGPPARR